MCGCVYADLYLLHTTKMLILLAKWGHFWDHFRGLFEGKDLGLGKWVRVSRVSFHTSEGRLITAVSAGTSAAQLLYFPPGAAVLPL